VQGGGGDARERTASRLVDGFLRGHHGLVALMVRDLETPTPKLCRNREVFDLVMPDVPMARTLWDRILSKSIRGDGVSPEALADAFRLTPGQMVQAVNGSVQRLASAGVKKPKIDYELLSEVIKEQVRHRLGENASLVRDKYTWDDLILTDDCRLQLREFVSRYYQRNKVLDSWGFGARFGYEMGLSALFDGPPGTGKTMAASIVAAELGLDLYKIDLSRIVSRYVGETEKNLSRVFDEAERARAMLLFDEADSLFAKRTSVQSSNDRYANLEVNYLLQRVETFTGVAVLTTNFASSIDEAFARRLSMRITFPKPEAPERERLWKSMMINPGLIKGEVDFAYLGAEFELAGGHIKNAVLRAAFIAASRDRMIDEDLLDLAARIEMKEQGMLVHGNPIEELWADDQDSGS
jgi:AAA+ superfamily predicted ATPase